MVLFLTLKEWAAAPQVPWRKNFKAMLTKRCAQFEVHFAPLASIPMLVQGLTRFQNSILSLTQSVASITNNISNVAKTSIAVRQSKSLEDGEIGKQFALVWKVLAEKLEVLFPEGDDTGTFIVPALDVRSQVLSIKDRRNGVGKPVFKLAPFGNGQLFALTAPYLRVPGIPDEVLQRVISQASQLAQNSAANV